MTLDEAKVLLRDADNLFKGACGHRMTQLRVPGVPVEWLHAMGTDLSPLFRVDHPSAGVLGGEGVLAPSPMGDL